MLLLFDPTFGNCFVKTVSTQNCTEHFWQFAVVSKWERTVNFIRNPSMYNGDSWISKQDNGSKHRAIHSTRVSQSIS